MAQADSSDCRFLVVNDRKEDCVMLVAPLPGVRENSLGGFLRSMLGPAQHTPKLLVFVEDIRNIFGVPEHL